VFGFVLGEEWIQHFSSSVQQFLKCFFLKFTVQVPLYLCERPVYGCIPLFSIAKSVRIQTQKPPKPSSLSP
jgi:hypothetical protein